MKIIRLLLICVAISALATEGRAGTPASLRVTGTFSNVRYHEETGDVTGLEIRIVAVAGRRLQAIIQLFEGEPSEVRVVDLKRNGLRVSFPLPDLWSSEDGRFEGTVSKTKLSGTITYATGVKEQLELKRSKSYWD